MDVVNLLVIVMVAAAYKHADGKKIDGRRVLVDVERARTVKGWLPRRLGKLSASTPLDNLQLILSADCGYAGLL